MPRNNIPLNRFAMPKRVQLPNRRVFFEKYERVGRIALPERVRIRRTYQRKICPRNKRKPTRRRNVQVGSGMAIDDLTSAGIVLGKSSNIKTWENANKRHYRLHTNGM